MPATEFVVHLAKVDYQPNAGWACAALSIPSAEVTRLVVAGRTLVAEDFLALRGRLRLAEGVAVGDALATITITRRLWTLRSSVAVAVATVLFTLIAVAAAYHGAPERAGVEAR